TSVIFVNKGSVAANTAAYGWGEKTVEIVTSGGTYTARVDIITKVLTTAADITNLDSFMLELEGSSTGAVGGYFILGGNIDMENAVVAGVGGEPTVATAGSGNGASTFTATRAFKGIFDGKGYAISNFKITDKFGGLFSMIGVGGIFRNTALVNFTVGAASAPAAGVAYIAEGATIHDVFVKGTVYAQYASKQTDFNSLIVGHVNKMGADAAKKTTIHDVIAVVENWTVVAASERFGAVIGAIDPVEYYKGQHDIYNVYSVNLTGPAGTLGGVVYGSMTSGESARYVPAVSTEYRGRGSNMMGASQTEASTHTDSHTLATLATSGGNGDIAQQMKDGNIRSFQQNADIALWLSYGNLFAGFTSTVWVKDAAALPTFKTAA
ncbi:MAG: hypothetical protein LBM78_01505, partial [Clostridiales bacterium]|nr:hypothetical protein [Clostridiales bacterium]